MFAVRPIERWIQLSTASSNQTQPTARQLRRIGAPSIRSLRMPDQAASVPIQHQAFVTKRRSIGVDFDSSG